RELFGIEARGLSFEIFVNFASLLAVLLIYRHDIYRLIKNGILFITKKDEQAKSDFQFILYLVIGTIPVGVVGLLFGDVIGEALSNTKIVGFTLLITAVAIRSEEHTSELQSRFDLVCRLLLEKKKNIVILSF